MKKKNIQNFITHPYFFLGVLSLGVIPFLFFLSSFFSQLQELEEIERTITRLHLKQERIKGRGESKEAFLSKMKNADHFYIDKHLETLSFLESEIAQLELQTDPILRKRLDFLKGNNKLLFAEQEIRRGDLFQEVEERLQHSVEMNQEDLKKLLCLIEETPIPPFSPVPEAPQLLIKQFELVKKQISLDQDVYIINLQLIKREGK